MSVLAERDRVIQEGGKTAVTCVFDGWGAFCELGKNRLGELASRVDLLFVCFLEVELG